MHMHVETGRVIAACFALAAFAVAIIAGLAGGAGTAQVLLRAVIAMMLCYPVGWVAGMVCERVIRAHVESEGTKASSQSGVEGAAFDAASSSEVDHQLADPMREENRAAA
jgi:hypothetical protein